MGLSLLLPYDKIVSELCLQRPEPRHRSSGPNTQNALRRRSRLDGVRRSGQRGRHRSRGVVCIWCRRQSLRSRTFVRSFENRRCNNPSRFTSDVSNVIDLGWRFVNETQKGEDRKGGLGPSPPITTRNELRNGRCAYSCHHLVSCPIDSEHKIHGAAAPGRNGVGF